jgi:hypothetical protein
MVAEDLAEFSARVLRPALELKPDGMGSRHWTMRQSTHKSIQQAASYYDEQEHAQSNSARIGLYSSDS